MRTVLPRVLCLLVACDTHDGSPVDDARLLGEALELVEDDPVEAADLCLEVEARDIRSSCAWAVAEAGGDEAPEAIREMCEALSGFRQDECFFTLARATEDWTVCADAGEYAVHCERHLFIRDLEAWLGEPPVPGRIEPKVLAALERFAVEPDHEITWRDIYREALVGLPFPDARACSPVQDPGLRAYCLASAEELQHHLLDNLVSTNKLYCKGPLPGRYAEVEDPAFLQSAARWRAEGRCTPGADPAEERRPSRKARR